MKQASRNTNRVYVKALNIIRLLETDCGVYDLKVNDIPIWWFIRDRFSIWAMGHFSEAQGDNTFSNTEHSSGFFSNIVSFCFRGSVFLLRSLSGIIHTIGVKLRHSRKSRVMFFTLSAAVRGRKDGRKFDMVVDLLYSRISDRSLVVERTTLSNWDFQSLLHRKNTIFYDWMMLLSVLKSLPRFRKAPAIKGWNLFESKCRDVDFVGISAEELLDVVMWLICQHSFKVLVEVGAAQMLIQAFKPSVVVETTSYDSAARALTLAARRRGLPVVELQHGMIYGSHPGYAFFIPDDYQGERPIPNRILAYGEASKQAILETGNAFVAEDIVVTGFPRLATYLKDIDRGKRQRVRDEVRAYLGINEATFVATVTSDYLIAPRLAGFLAETLQNLERNRFVFCIKLHPIEPDTSYKAIAQDPRIRILSDKDVDLYDLLAASDVHVTVDTSVFVECFALGVPNIIVAYSDHDSPVLEVVEQSEITTVNTPQMFIEELSKLSEDSTHKEMVVAKGRQIAGRFFANEDYPENAIISEITRYTMCAERD